MGFNSAFKVLILCYTCLSALRIGSNYGKAQNIVAYSLGKRNDLTNTAIASLILFTYFGKWRGGGAAVPQWLRRYATNRKIAGSIPDGVIGIFH